VNVIQPDILATIGNTPVVRINKLAPEGVNLFVKCEAFNPMASVKDRMALSRRQPVRQVRGLQPDGIGQGPHGFVHHRGGRGQR
jgi:cysteine synthase